MLLPIKRLSVVAYIPLYYSICSVDSRLGDWVMHPIFKRCPPLIQWGYDTKYEHFILINNQVVINVGK